MKMIYIEIDKPRFRDAFRAAGRQDQFSHEALDLLYDYLNNFDEDVKLDVIAICCEYVEDTPTEIAQSYDIDLEHLIGADDEIIDAFVLSELRNNTSVVGSTPQGTIVYEDF